jgi:hypothetical protein
MHKLGESIPFVLSEADQLFFRRELFRWGSAEVPALGLNADGVIMHHDRNLDTSAT